MDSQQPQPTTSRANSSLAWYMIAAILAATLFAWAAPTWAAKLQLGGDVFLSVLKMIVVPLVMASVMNGVLSLGDVRRLGRAGGHTILYYMATTLLAVLTGLLLVNLVQPGVGALSPEQVETAGLLETESLSTEDQQTRTLGAAFEKLVKLLFTDNLFRSMADGDLLPLILFSIVFAAVLTTLGRRAEPITRLIVEVNHALMNFVLLLMKVAPIGIFCLVASQFGRAMSDDAFLDSLGGLALFMLTVIGGLGIHFFISLPLILFVATRRNPFRFLQRMSEAVLTAFSTASSSATLPVSMECAMERAGVSRRSTEFVLPLGATINMDGTALYEAVAVLFIAQGLGVQLEAVDQITIIITATLAAIGAAGIPHAGLVTLVIVLNAVGLPLGGIGIILTVDVILDRFRTATNVFGDAVGAAVVEKSFREWRR